MLNSNTLPDEQPKTFRLGIMGGGQLARMLMLAAHPLGIQVRCLDPDPNAPGGHVGSQVIGAYDDLASLDCFAQGLDAVTYEFENVSTAALDHLAAQNIPIYPPPIALAIGQDRLLEKTLFTELGIAVPPFAAVSTRDQAAAAIADVGIPCVMKTRRMGYDGKGQRVLRAADTNPDANPDANFIANESSNSSHANHATHAREAFDSLGGVPVLIEAFVPFIREVSIVAVRDLHGSFDAYPLTQNTHEDGILRLSIAPAIDSGSLETTARAAAQKIMDRLNYVGVLTVEFFVIRDAQGTEHLLANELAPRVHNSGHWTIEGATTSQFENHIRACAGLPLGPTTMRAGVACSAMVNFIGSWPAPAKLLESPGIHPHIYGKSAREGRKVGHATIVGTSRDAVMELVARVASPA